MSGKDEDQYELDEEEEKIRMIWMKKRTNEKNL